MQMTIIFYLFYIFRLHAKYMCLFQLYLQSAKDLSLSLNQTTKSVSNCDPFYPKCHISCVIFIPLYVKPDLHLVYCLQRDDIASIH